MDENFHARFKAMARRYRYVVYNAPTRPALLYSTSKSPIYTKN